MYIYILEQFEGGALLVRPSYIHTLLNLATPIYLILETRFDIEDDNYLNLDKQTNVHILTGTVKLFFR